MSEPSFSPSPDVQRLLSGLSTPKFGRPANEGPYESIDNRRRDPNHSSMTDLTRQEMTAALGQNKAEVDARLANFDTSIKTGFADLRAEFAEMRAEMAKQTGEMRAEMANVRADSHKATTEVTRWVVGFGIAILGAIFAFARVSDRPATPGAAVVQPTAQQQAPLVVAVPAGSTVLSAPQAPATAQPPAK